MAEKRPIRPLFRDSRRIRREVDEEIAFHIEMRIAELIREGADPQEARRRALRRFGDLEQTRTACFRSDRRRERQMRRREYLREVAGDLRHGLRQVRSRPGFALAVIVTLAVAIGATTAVFSVADHVLLRPLPYENSERVVTLWETDRSQGFLKGKVAPGNFAEWRERSSSFESLGLAEPTGFDLTGEGPPRSVPSWSVSDGFFEALGVRPAAGRLFTREEYGPDAPRVVMISHGLWQRRYGGDPAIVGGTIQVDFAPATVVGVLPPDLDYPGAKDLWTPKEWRERETRDRRSGYMDAVGRLRPGVSASQAQADMDRVAAALAAEYPQTNATAGVNVVPLREQVVGDVRPALLVLLGAVGFVLLIACANVASLLLARGSGRAKEIAVRGALGAGRGRLLRQMITESLALGLLGGALGVALAAVGVRVLTALGPPDLPRIEGIGLDARLLLFAVGVTLLASLASALMPAVRSARTSFSSTLRGSGRSVTTDRERGRLRGALVVSQIALALVLLVGAGLLVRSFLDLLSNDLGFETENRVALQLFIWDHNPTDEARLQRVAELDQRLESVPGVTGASVVFSLPFHPTGLHTSRTLRLEGQPEPATDQEAQVFMNTAAPDYFEVMGIRLLRGRPFEPADRAGSAPVVIINETVARRFFEGRDPVGRKVILGRGERALSAEVVGVVADVRPTALDSDPQPELYVPYAQSATGSVTLVVRTAWDAGALLPSLREAVWQVDERQAVYHAGTLESMVADTLVERRFNLVLLAVFSLAALVLAAVGIYGLISFATRERVQEIGVRLALGARPVDVVALVVRQGLLLAVPGIVLGLSGALFLTRFLEHMLYGVTPTDPGTLAAVALLMLAVSLAAAYVPARRAAALDPAETLREA